jgi:hypothetical protein
MLLLVQSRTPTDVPYFDGETYAFIPRLLVPRLLDPDKPRGHEGTYMMAIAYGLQTSDHTFRYTIGFGLLAEAYANYGFAGVVGLSLLIGWCCAAATRLSLRLPVTSLRSLFSLLVMSAMIQSEYAAGVLISSLFQSSVVLIIAALVVMRLQPYQPETPSGGGRLAVLYK